MPIDAYTHFIPPDYLKSLSQIKNPEVKKVVEETRNLCAIHSNFTDFKERLSDMDKHGMSHQIAVMQPTIDPNLLPIEGEDYSGLCRLFNTKMSDLTEKSSGRIVTLGVAPVRSNDRSMVRSEIMFALEELGMKGFLITTNLNGAPADSFNIFWEEVAKYNTVVYVHPVDPPVAGPRSYEDEYDMTHVFGWPFETTIILSRLVLSGMMDRCQNVKIVAHHLGGMIPFFMGRISESYDSGMFVMKAEQKRGVRLLKSKVTDYFKQFYFDTAVGGSASAIKCGYDVFGSKHLLFSTDYPWGPDNGRGRLASYRRMIDQIGFPENDLLDILEGNARRLFGL